MRTVLLMPLLVILPGILHADGVDYTRQVKPILDVHCAACHGSLAQKGKLRLDHGSFIRQGGRTGLAVLPGNGQKSLLIQAVTGKESLRMPPEKDGTALQPGQVELLIRWIDEGAKSPKEEPLPRDPSQHWAFQKPRKQPINSKSTFHPIDHFLDQALQSQKLVPASEASRNILTRRLYLDLLGMPPTPLEIQEFLADTTPDAYEKMVDRLLMDPRHGERWARHWMDIWRYSDWYGRRNVPDVWNSAPQIWRWRDWIVNSINANHGYDRMVGEMLAADEITPGDDNSAVATGYLVRNWYALNPNDWMRNIVEHTGKAFLGLTFNCAHCHDHKYDPIRQEDYFGFRAFFEPIYVRQDRVSGEADPGPFQDYNYSTLRKIQRLGMVRVFDKTPDAPTWFYAGGDERNRMKDHGPIAPHMPTVFVQPAPSIQEIELPAETAKPALRSWVRQELLSESRGAITKAEESFEKVKASLPSSLEGKQGELARRRVQAAEKKLQATKAGLTDLNARLSAELAMSSKPLPANLTELKSLAAQLERQTRLLRAQAELESGEIALEDAQQLANDKRKAATDAANKQITLARNELQKVEKDAKDPAQVSNYTPLGPVYPGKSTGRRKALAQWITSRENPLAARVAVNHIWNWHFHSPLVATVHDFGRNGKTPTHPELLDWLAVEFMESGWSMKHLHRLIVTSNAYKRSSTNITPSRDPENIFLAHGNVGHMEAEVLRDSLLACAGKLDSRMGGQELENTEALKTFRRSIYYSIYPDGGGKGVIGDLFDGPDPLDCYRRSHSILPQQALALTNSELIHQLSDEVASLISSQIPNPASDADFIQQSFARILSRPPAPAELHSCGLFLAGSSDVRARAGLIRALFNHNDFISIR